MARAHLLILRRTFGGECADIAICQPERGLFGLIDGEVDWSGLPTHLGAESACAAILGALDGWSPDLAGSPESADLLCDALRRASDAILEAAARDDRFRGLGASAALLGVGPSGWTTAHVGDARVYGARTSKVSLLTKDHSLFNELVDRDELREEDFDGFIHNSVITQALGMSRAVDVRTRIATRSPKDSFVLCTQGLWRALGPAATLELLRAHASDPDALFDAFRAALAGRHHQDASAIAVTL